MLGQLEAYIAEPSLARAERLWAAITQFDMRDFASAEPELWRIWAGRGEPADEPRFMVSNGSMGEVTYYKCGPYFRAFWRHHVESLLTPDPSATALVVPSHGVSQRSEGLVLRPGTSCRLLRVDEPKHRYVILGDLVRDPESFRICLGRLFKDHGPAWLMGKHEGLVPLLSCVLDPSYAGKVHGIINTDTDLNCTSSAWKVLDQMVSWVSGCNFWTCPCGGLHVLPLYARDGGRIANVVNLYGDSAPNDDQWEVEPATMCGCGRRSCRLTFLSHARHNPGPLPNFEMLTGRYMIVQYLVDGDTVHAFMPPAWYHDVPSADTDYVNGWWQDRGKTVVFHLQEHFVVGSAKRPPGWMAPLEHVRLVRYQAVL